MRRRARVDANQGEIIAFWRSLGASVYVASAFGDGFVDTVVGFRRQTYLAELKDGRKPPSARRLTPRQQAFHATWAGAPIHIITSKAEAAAMLGVELVERRAPYAHVVRALAEERERESA